MRGLRLEDCPPGLRLRVEEALRRQKGGSAGIFSSSDLKTGLRIAQDAPEGPDLAGTRAGGPGREEGGVSPLRRAPNKTEAEYNRAQLGGRGVYEAITLRLPGGSRYTPDWVVIDPDGGVELHEVKGSYRLGSHGRARTAFREAAAAFPCFRFVWAERQKDRSWDVRRFDASKTGAVPGVRDAKSRVYGS